MSIKDGDLDYIVADGTCTDALEVVVHTLMEEGYKPHGSMVVVEYQPRQPLFLQPMVLSE